MPASYIVFGSLGSGSEAVDRRDMQVNACDRLSYPGAVFVSFFIWDLTFRALLHSFLVSRPSSEGLEGRDMQVNACAVSAIEES